MQYTSSPNLHLPTKTGIPARDKAEIRDWLAWGRMHVKYLQVRKDLPQWPAAGKVDGSAHIIGNKGIVFLFNPNPEALEAHFVLNEESIGLATGTRFAVTQSYPTAELKQKLNLGANLAWIVPPQTAVILAIDPSID